MNFNEIGRLGRDAETVTTKNGTTFVKYSLAIDEYNYEKKENETRWVNVIDTTEKGQKLKQYLTKGKMLNVIGDYRDSIFNGQKGPMISRDVHVFNWNFVNIGKNDSQTANDVTSTATPQPTVMQIPTPVAAATTGTFVAPNPTTVEPKQASDDLPF